MCGGLGEGKLAFEVWWFAALYPLQQRDFGEFIAYCSFSLQGGMSCLSWHIMLRLWQQGMLRAYS
jgi:hypothetical protein